MSSVVRLVVPERIGKYRISAVIGRGAMGVVYKAFDPNIERVVALKTIRKELLEDEQREAAIARFKNEARAAGRLAHPNIVAIHDYGEDEEAAYIVMEFVDGTPLGALMAEGVPVEPRRAHAWMQQVLRGLYYAHSRGVTHRDIKPANVLVTAAGVVKVTDFGIAHVDRSNLTASGAVIGTPSYMSPEQLRGDPVDGRSDLFSAGIVLYQLLTGARPFQGSSTEVMQKILNVQPAAPSSIVPRLGAALDGVLARALAKEPEQRFATAGQFLAALAQAMQPADAAAEPPLIAPDDADDATRVGPLPVRAATPSPPAAAAGADSTVDWKAALATPVATRFADLSGLIGPMATFIVRKALEQSPDPAALCAALDPHIKSPQGRAGLRRAVDDALVAASGGTMHAATTSASLHAMSPAAAPAAGAPPALVLEPKFVTEALALLTDEIGPVARIYVGKAARAARSREEFCRLLADAIANPAQRAGFVRRLAAR
ncbi:MAG TPA: serine/threonine-protein kinase [Burkholderiaceae bacterium]|nr:serine/threonine-protein kinase [Burkholderiaceae bacterium]